MANKADKIGYSLATLSTIWLRISLAMVESVLHNMPPCFGESDHWVPPCGWGVGTNPSGSLRVSLGSLEAGECCGEESSVGLEFTSYASEGTCGLLGKDEVPRGAESAGVSSRTADWTSACDTLVA